MFLDFNSIRQRVANGAYNSKISYPTEGKWPEGHIVDYEQTVRWNIEMVQAHNQGVQDEKKKYQEHQNKLQMLFQTDMIKAIQEDANISTKSAELVFENAYERARSDGFNAIINETERFCDFVGDLLMFERNR